MMLISGCEPISDMSMRPNPINTGDITDNETPVTPPEDNRSDNGDDTRDDPPEENGDTSDGASFAALQGAPIASNPITISSPRGALYNLTDDIFLYGKDIDRRISPGAGVKLLTALTAYDAVPHDTHFTVGSEINMIGAGAGITGLRAEQVLGLRSILAAMLITVGNDASYTVSINTARALSAHGDSSDRELNDYFIRLMNSYAEALGCSNSSFLNPCGFDANGQYSTIRDLTLIAAAAATNPMISELVGTREARFHFESGEHADYVNINSLMNLEGWDIRGMRIGYTDLSAFSTQILAHINGKRYIIVVSGSENQTQRERDVIRLLEMAQDGADLDIISGFYD